jgi:hypothetical protein
MKRLTALAAVSALALAIPAAAPAGNGGHGKETRKLAHQQCKAEKKADRAAFRANYGKHPMKTCVREASAGVVEEFKNAAKECKAEREQDPAQFAADYGERRNAYGKCVSSKVRDEIEAEVDAFDSAAEECRAKFEADPAGFNERYGGEPEPKRRHEEPETPLEEKPEAPDVEMDPEAFANCVAERSEDDVDAPKDPVEVDGDPEEPVAEPDPEVK